MGNKRGENSCQVISNQHLFDDIYQLTLQAPAIAAVAIAGQFVEIGCSTQGRNLLNRPFGIYKADSNAGTISIFYAVCGEETLALSTAETGNWLTVIGPLGNGFPVKDIKKPVIIGAGTGMGPTRYLASQFSIQGIRPVFLFGQNSNAGISYFQEVSQISAFQFASMDGSYGFHGTVVELFQQWLETGQTDCVYVCGPEIVMKKTAALCKVHGIPCYVSMETVMGCGFGVCLGCTLPVKVGGEITYQCVCKDGPVFSGEEVVWHE